MRPRPEADAVVAEWRGLALGSATPHLAASCGIKEPNRSKIIERRMRRAEAAASSASAAYPLLSHLARGLLHLEHFVQPASLSLGRRALRSRQHLHRREPAIATDGERVADYNLPAGAGGRAVHRNRSSGAGVVRYSTSEDQPASLQKYI